MLPLGIVRGSAALLLFLEVCQAYFRMSCGTVQTGRIDPVVSPGSISSHVHRIAGASNIGLSSTYNDLQKAACTSCTVQDDKSAYWTPQLYYQHSNGSFEEVPGGDTIVYYLGRGENRTNVQPFPPGFRMVSGDFTLRSYDTDYTFGGQNGVTLVNGTCDGNGTCTQGTWVDGSVPGGQTYLGRPIGDRISYRCLNGVETEVPNLNMTDCAYGLRVQLQFQSCWDGVNLYKSDNSHVAYMSQIDNGVCPPTHPVQLIHLFFEILYLVNNIDKSNGGQFVWSYGDPTGYGFHGDFLNGWNENTLTNALAQCAIPDNGGQISNCAPLMQSEQDESDKNCPEQPALINEPVHGMLPNLPGCIKVTSGPAAAPLSSMVCPAGSPQPSLGPTPSSPSSPGATFFPTPGKTYNSWTYLGCATDSASLRTLAGPSTSSDSMTTEQCQTFCAEHGAPLAGTEYGSQCFCGVSLTQGATLGLDCGASGGAMVCGGNRSEMCGGPARLSVWNSTAYQGPYHSFPVSVGDALPYDGGSGKQASYLGCAPDNVGGQGRALGGPSSRGNASMSIESCLSFCAAQGMSVAGVEYADECYCGDELGGGSQAGDSQACVMPCAGNMTEWCGGPNALNVWSLPS